VEISQQQEQKNNNKYIYIWNKNHLGIENGRVKDAKYVIFDNIRNIIEKNFFFFYTLLHPNPMHK